MAKAKGIPRPRIPLNAKDILNPKTIMQQTSENKPVFETEFHFFLHNLISHQNLVIPDNTDEYNNLYQREENTRREDADTTNEVEDPADLDGRVPISFNFRIPQTLIFKNGKLSEWYNINEMGNVTLRRHKEEDLKALVKEKMVDYTTPIFSAYRKPVETTNQDGKTELKIKRDLISSGRAK